MINNWWKVHVDVISLSKVMNNSILPNLVWKLMGIWDVGFRDCKYLKNDKMVKAWNFNKDLSNRNILKFVKFGVCRVYRFWVIKDFPNCSQKWAPSRLNRVKATEAVTCGVFQNNCWQMFQWKQLNSDLKFC